MSELKNNETLVSQFIVDCLARELSEWEQNFVNSLNLQLQRGKVLTEKQLSKLQSIWEEVTDKQPTV